MPRGGPRSGSGRPTKEEAAKRAKLLALAIEQGPEITPRQFLTGIMHDPSPSKVMRMQAAVALSKLPAEPSPRSNGQGNSSEQPLIAYSLPRGSSIDLKTGKIIFPPGIEPELVEPYTGTPPLLMTDEHEFKREQPERLPVRAVDMTNVTPLHRDEDGPDAA